VLIGRQSQENKDGLDDDNDDDDDNNNNNNNNNNRLYNVTE
jgi:hypothetical protein